MDKINGLKLFLLFLAIFFGIAFFIFHSYAIEDQIQIKLHVVGPTQTLTPTPTFTPQPSGGEGGGGEFPDNSTPIIFNLVIIPGVDSAIISWETSKPSLSQLYWGKTLDYNLGSFSEYNFFLKHSTKIENLSPETEYYLKIEIRDLWNMTNKLEGQKFKTLASPDKEPPENVRNFKAIPTGEMIVLTWKNPSDKDFELVRILRSTKFYPQDPRDGMLVYEGNGEKTIDNQVEIGRIYYYTAFTRDRSYNYSSGVLASVKLRMVKPTPTSIIPSETPIEIPLFPKEPFEDFSQICDDSGVIKLSLFDFVFVQDGIKLPFTGDTVLVNGLKNLSVYISANKVPDIVKTFVITYYDSLDYNNSQSFLLKFNSDKNIYETTIGAFGNAGLYPFKITILDYKHNILKKICSKFIVKAEAVPKLYQWYLQINWRLLIIILIVLALVYFVKKLRDKI